MNNLFIFAAAALMSVVSVLVRNRSMWVQIPVMIMAGIVWVLAGTVLYTLLI